MSFHQYLAIDLGAESGRVMLATLDAGRLGMEEMHRFQNGAIRVAGTLRWDLVRLWAEIKTGLAKAAARGVKAEGISVDSWALDYVLMRGSEPQLRLPYAYRDPRTHAPYAAARAAAEAEIYEQTGIQFMPINTLYQLLADRDEDRAQLEMADSFLMVAEWFHWLLCGVAVIEESNASTTQLYDPRRRDWSDELIARFELPRRIFPRIVPPGTRLGPLLPEIAEETGLGQIEIVAGCTHDTGAAVAAVPAEGRGWAYLSSGTWSLLGAELDAPLITEAARRGNFTNEVGYGGSIRFLKNIVGLWILQECRRDWVRTGETSDYAVLTREAAAAESLCSLIDPDDARFLQPDDMPAKVRAFCRETGQPDPDTPGRIARCVLESLALLYRVRLEELEAITGMSIDRLHIVGGGSQSPLLNQFTASAISRTVLAGPTEATAIGNALLQAVALGHLAGLPELRSVVRDSFPLARFEPRDTAEWAAANERFARLRS